MIARYTRATALVVLSLGLAYPHTAAAQSSLPTFEELAGTINPLGILDIPSVGAPSLVDLDGDGAVDLVYSPANVEILPEREAGGNLPFLLFESTADAVGFVEAEVNPFADLSTGNAEERGGVPAFGDVDGDGDLDMVVGTSAQGSTPRYVYFENAGSATSPAFTRRDGAANPFASLVTGFLTLADLDADEDLDAVVVVPGEEGATTLYFENTGTAQTPTFVMATSPFADIVFEGIVFPLAFGDFDDDGDLDASVGEIDAFGSGEGSLRLLENKGTATAAAFEVPASNPFASVVFGAFGDDTVAPAAGDLDGDGDVDVVVIIGAGPFPQSLFLENEGGEGSFSFALRTGFDNPIRVRTPLDEVIVPTSAGDLDGDGDQDLVIGLTSQGPLYYAENVGSAEQAIFRLRTGAANPFRVYTNPSDTFAAPSLVDLDGDGDLDVVIAGADFENTAGQIVYLENTGTPTAPTFARRTGTANPFGALGFTIPTSAAFADLDGDGDLDLALVDADATLVGRLKYFENTGTASVPTFTLRSGAASPLPAVTGAFFRGVAFGDLDGDLDADLLLTEASIDSETGVGSVRVFENGGSQESPTFVERTWDDNPLAGTFVLPTQPSIADFDGDGNPDIVVGTALLADFGEGEFGLVSNRFRFFLNNGDASPVSAETGVQTPDGFALGVAYPNPFVGEVAFGLTLDREQPVIVSVYDALGRRVAVLHDGPLAAGRVHEFRLDGAALAPGLYIVQARGVQGVAAQKVTKLR